MNWTEQQINTLIRKIYNGKYNALNLPKKLYNDIASHLTEGVYKGYGNVISKVAYDSPDFAMLTNLRENVYLFSAAKTFNYVLETENLIVEANEVLPFKIFKERALTIYDQYNVTWLETEYNTAIAQSQHARAWNDFDEDAILKYMLTSGIEHAQVCLDMQGVSRPKKDDIWLTKSPQNHFNCFTGDTEIKTPLGWKRIDQIKKGDLVIGGSCESRNVTGLHINDISDQVCIIAIKNNRISSTKNHRFLTLHGWKRAENVKPFDIIIDNVNPGFFNKLICHINNIIAIVAYFTMPVIAKRKSFAVNTFNYYAQFFNKKINIFTINYFIAHNNKTFASKVINNRLLAFSRLLVILCMPFWMIYKCLNCFFISPISGFYIKHRIVYRHSMSSIFSDGAKHGVGDCFSKTIKVIRGLLLSLLSANPRGGNTLGYGSCFKSIVRQKPHYSSIINLPFIANFWNRKHINKVDTEEGFFDGEPLNRFDSVYGFLKWSFWHRKYRLVRSNTNIQYTGMVYNLSVEKDESYITRVGIVHNCLCYLDASFDNKPTKTPKNIANPDQGFGNNPGITKEVFNKEHPYFDVEPKYKKFAKTNFGLPLPE